MTVTWDTLLECVCLEIRACSCSHFMERVKLHADNVEPILKKLAAFPCILIAFLFQRDHYLVIVRIRVKNHLFKEF